MFVLCRFERCAYQTARGSVNKPSYVLLFIWRRSHSSPTWLKNIWNNCVKGLLTLPSYLTPKLPVRINLLRKPLCFQTMHSHYRPLCTELGEKVAHENTFIRMFIALDNKALTDDPKYTRARIDISGEDYPISITKTMTVAWQAVGTACRSTANLFVFFGEISCSQTCF